jgi:hypothetical protein
MMEPSTEPNDRITSKTLVCQLNEYCQADVKTLWTLKRLRNSREVCGFSYVENQYGEWIMMPVLCTNCQHILEKAICGLSVIIEPNKLKNKNTVETNINNLFSTPLEPPQTDATDIDYLLYPATHNRTNNKLEGLELYRPSLASGGCCAIL